MLKLMRMSCFLLGLGLLALCLANAAAAEEIDWQTDLDTAWDEAIELRRPLLVFVTRDDCSYCIKMKKSTYVDKHVVQQVGDGFVPLVIDAADEERFVRDLKVVAFPTTIVIAPNRTVVERIKGHVAAPEFQTRLAEAQQRVANLERQAASNRRVTTKTR